MAPYLASGTSWYRCRCPLVRGSSNEGGPRSSRTPAWCLGWPPHGPRWLFHFCPRPWFSQGVPSPASVVVPSRRPWNSQSGPGAPAPVFVPGFWEVFFSGAVLLVLATVSLALVWSSAAVFILTRRSFHPFVSSAAYSSAAAFVRTAPSGCVGRCRTRTSG